ncbi:YbfB/YjiJ family MFS transporter [Aliihoeflea sp. PC F10.4]
MSAALPNPLRLALAGMFAMATAMGIGRFVYTPILPGMMEALDQSASEVGFIAAANYAGYLIGAIVAGGGWAHGFERRIALASLLASAALCLAMAATNELAAFMAIRFAAGVASAFIMVFLSSIVFAELARAGHAKLQWLHFGGVGLGIALSSLVVAGVASAGFGWKGEWVAAGLVSFAAIAIVYWLLGDAGSHIADAKKEPPLVFSPALRSIVWAYGVFGFGYIVTATFLIAIVRSNAPDPALETGVWLVTGLAGFPSVLVWSWIASKWGLRPAFAAACIVEALGVAASVAIGGAAGPLLGGVLLGGTFIAITALGLQAGRMLAGPSPRKALAVMTAAFGTGQIVGPVVAGFIADWTGGFFWPSILAALALAISAWLALSSKAAAPRPAA